MLRTLQYGVQALREYIIRAASPSTWSFSFSGLFTFFTVAFLLLFCLFKRIRTMQNGSQKPFPFMELPPELRDMVYMNLLEDPYYPPPPVCLKHNGSPLNLVLHRHQPHAHRKQSNWIFLANKQIYAEYMDVICKKSTFNLTISPHNYTVPTTPTQPTAAESKRIWNISPDTLKNLRKCSIKLISTKAMLCVEDPRDMKPEDWALARQMREELKEVGNVQELNLHIKAVGDPLWNPLWIWYHASQSLKTMGSATAGQGPTGPKVNRITFSLDSWTPGENYLERDPQNDNQWTWRCMKGHCIGADGKADMAVRDFCWKLYDQCRTCNPDLESEDEEEE